MQQPILERSIHNICSLAESLNVSVTVNFPAMDGLIYANGTDIVCSSLEEVEKHLEQLKCQKLIQASLPTLPREAIARIYQIVSYYQP